MKSGSNTDANQQRAADFHPSSSSSGWMVACVLLQTETGDQSPGPSCLRVAFRGCGNPQRWLRFIAPAVCLQESQRAAVPKHLRVPGSPPRHPSPGLTPEPAAGLFPVPHWCRRPRLDRAQNSAGQLSGAFMNLLQHQPPTETRAAESTDA